jgi:hypothetical protein
MGLEDLRKVAPAASMASVAIAVESVRRTLQELMPVDTQLDVRKTLDGIYELQALVDTWSKLNMSEDLRTALQDWHQVAQSEPLDNMQHLITEAVVSSDFKRVEAEIEKVDGMYAHWKSGEDVNLVRMRPTDATAINTASFRRFSRLRMLLKDKVVGSTKCVWCGQQTDEYGVHPLRCSSGPARSFNIAAHSKIAQAVKGAVERIAPTTSFRTMIEPRYATLDGWRVRRAASLDHPEGGDDGEPTGQRADVVITDTTDSLGPNSTVVLDVSRAAPMGASGAGARARERLKRNRISRLWQDENGKSPPSNFYPFVFEHGVVLDVWLARRFTASRR